MEDAVQDIFVYFVPTIVLVTTLVIGNAVFIQRDLMKKGTYRKRGTWNWKDEENNVDS